MAPSEEAPESDHFGGDASGPMSHLLLCLLCLMLGLVWVPVESGVEVLGLESEEESGWLLGWWPLGVGFHTAVCLGSYVHQTVHPDTAWG